MLFNPFLLLSMSDDGRTTRLLWAPPRWRRAGRCAHCACRWLVGKAAPGLSTRSAPRCRRLPAPPRSSSRALRCRCLPAQPGSSRFLRASAVPHGAPAAHRRLVGERAPGSSARTAPRRSVRPLPVAAWWGSGHLDRQCARRRAVAASRRLQTPPRRRRAGRCTRRPSPIGEKGSAWIVCASGAALMLPPGACRLLRAPPRRHCGLPVRPFRAPRVSRLAPLAP